MARPRKFASRTRSGRLSRAYKGPARDAGTPELQRKKLAAVNGSADPALSATPASILFAHGVLTRDQLAAAEKYRKAYALSFGLPWRGASTLDDGIRGAPLPDAVLERSREQLDDMVSRLTAEQKLQIDNLLISGWVPTWFFAALGLAGRLRRTSANARPCSQV
jgi:hypothetical protein